MAGSRAVTCQIRYTLDLNKLSAFESYARTWMMLIERYGKVLERQHSEHDLRPRGRCRPPMEGEKGDRTSCKGSQEYRSTNPSPRLGRLHLHFDVGAIRGHDVQVAVRHQLHFSANR